MIEILKLQDSNPRSTPAVKPLTNNNKNGEDRIGELHCRSDAGSLSCLAGFTRPDVSMPVHQSYKLRIYPKNSYDNAVKCTGKCVKVAKDKGLILKPILKKGQETHVDADFLCAYEKDDSEDLSTVHSRKGFIIKYTNFPMTWK